MSDYEPMALFTTPILAKLRFNNKASLFELNNFNYAKFRDNPILFKDAATLDFLSNSPVR